MPPAVKRTESVATITGDVTVDDVTLNIKGGSLTAVLKKAIRAGLDMDARHCFGAKLDFAEGASCILMAAAEIGAQQRRSNAPKFRVTRVSSRRFVVDLVDNKLAPVEPLTQALLSIIKEQIKAGKRKFVSSDEAEHTIKHLREKSTERQSRLVAMQRKRNA